MARFALMLPGAIVAALLGGCGGHKPSSGPLTAFSFRDAKTLPVLERSFEFNGSAPPADRVASVARDGLRIGVRRHAPGKFEGYFAVTRTSFPANSVFHIRMYREPRQIASSRQTGETVFAVQTSNTKVTGDINYVLVASVSNGGLTHWEVGYAEGHLANASTKILWMGPSSATADQSEDVTLKTDGHASLEVSFGSKVVYASHKLNMHVVPPFQAYLEVQALQTPYEARFTDFRVLGS